MRKRLFLLSLLFLFSCSAGIHKYFRYNNFTSAANTYIINDSLKLYIRMPIDYNFVTDSKKLKRVIKKHKKEVSHLENVLVYGKTYVDPFYEIFITAGPGPKPQARKRNVVVLDTVLNKMPIYVVAINRDENAPNSFKIDASQILNSMRVGKNYRKNMLSVMDLSRRFEKTNRFLEAYNEIKNYPDSDRQQYWLKLQMQITYASFLGNHPDYTGLLKKFERPGERDSVYNAIEKKAVWNDDVYQKILEAAGHHKIIMFNENHFMPQHRLLLLNLLPELKKLGYRYLALEGLFSDTQINQPHGIPLLKTGFYTREQNFARLIRAAKKLGFKLVSYDTGGGFKVRERNQAENLYNKTFKTDPNARVVVLAGIAHVLEKETARKRKWMATLFKEKYNIDPLTISQTHLSRYRSLFSNKLGLVEGKIFKSQRLNSVDFLVLNNLRFNPTVEPEYNFTYTNDFNSPVQLNVFLKSEVASKFDFYGKVPYKVFYLPKSSQVKLYIPGNEYFVVIFDEQGHTLLSKKYPSLTSARN